MLFSRSVVWLCTPMDCNMPGFTVLHYLPDFCSNSCPLSQWYHLIISSSTAPSPPALNISQHPGLFQWVTLHIRWPKSWSFNFSSRPSDEYSGLISFRIDWFDRLAVQGTLNGPLQHSSNASVLQHSACLRVGTLTSIHDYWKILFFSNVNKYFLINCYVSDALLIAKAVAAALKEFSSLVRTWEWVINITAQEVRREVCARSYRFADRLPLLAAVGMCAEPGTLSWRCFLDRGGDVQSRQVESPLWRSFRQRLLQAPCLRAAEICQQIWKTHPWPQNW